MSQIQSVESLADVLSAVSRIQTGSNQHWWRGQSDASWSLRPGVFRFDRGFNYERTVTRRFMQRAGSRHSACPPKGHIGQWLFLMQHYGLPTRLLDWSEAPMVAAYFAVASGAGPASLFALNPFELNERHVGDRVLADVDSDVAQPLLQPAFRDAPDPQSKAVALLVDEADGRMLAQLTGFTLHATAEPLDSLEGAGDFLHRVEIPETARRRILRELWDHGIRRSTLFPDLGNLAAELRVLTFKKA